MDTMLSMTASSMVVPMAMLALVACIHENLALRTRRAVASIKTTSQN